jgi:hypothetical protein
MKRIIVAAVLLVSTVSVFAADVKSEGKNDQRKTEIKISGKEASECSLSLEATFGPSWGNVTVTCKGTASTCKEAVSIAKNCLEEAKRAIMQ